MNFIDKIAFAAGRLTLGGTPEGYDAKVLAALAEKRAGPVLHVARDDARLASLEQGLAFFAPGLRVMSLPAWDCLPYDRVSPNGEVVSRRIAAMSEIAKGFGGPSVVLTTVNAVLQRLPARDTFKGASFAARAGGKLDLTALQEFLARNGYRRAGTVREAGEYALRGGIVDLFPPGDDEPVRIDLFGDAIEAVRAFDPMSQLSGEARDGFRLQPVSEVMLDEAAIQRFRTGYRAAFGGNATEDPLYEAVSAGHRHPGLEHYLPLFAGKLETAFDYMPDAPIANDRGVEEAIVERLQQIEEFYRARRDIAQSPAAGEGAPVYRPLLPDRLYLTREELDASTWKRAVFDLAPFIPPEGAGLDAGGRLGRDFAEARARPDGRLLDTVREHIQAEIAAGRRVAVAAFTLGARERLSALLRQHGLDAQKPVTSWPEALALPATIAALAVLPAEHGFTDAELTLIGELAALAEGDFVVHVEHGIGRYEGLETLDIGGAPHDCLRAIYLGGDRLFIPVENIEVLSRYGSADSGAILDKLGGAAWQARRARVKQRLKDMAEELIRTAAERKVREGATLAPSDGMYEEFVARFPECEIGAMPQFGNLFGLPVYVDPTLAMDEWIYFNAGNHVQTVHMKYRDFVELVKPRVARLVEERKKWAA